MNKNQYLNYSCARARARALSLSLSLLKSTHLHICKIYLHNQHIS
jgi:hypothetical protein